MVNRHENEYPSRPWSKMSAGPDPARRYRMRAPSSSIQHSSTPVLAGDGESVETPRDWSVTTKSSRPEDNSFITARVYLKEHRLCSFHSGELRLPAFYLGARQSASGNSLTYAAVILGAADSPPFVGSPCAVSS